MEMNRQKLTERISATLRAKQFLAFFAIALVAIDFAAAMLSSYLQHPQSFGAVFQDSATGFYDLFHDPQLSVAVVVAVSLLLGAWLRCGYIRSLVGSLHYGPSGSIQFVSMFVLLIVTDLLQTGIQYLYQYPSLGEPLLSLLQLIVYLLLLYADYAIIVSALDPVRAIWRSAEAVRSNLIVSLLVVMAATLLYTLLQEIIDRLIVGSLVDSSGLVVLRVVTFGVINFFTDVVLLSTYIDSIERGALPVTKARTVRGVPEDEESAG